MTIGREARRRALKRVVIISADWRFRALLRAQLLEDGFEVLAGESAADVPGLITAGAAAPDLLVAELGGPAFQEHEAAELMRWAGQIPLWIVVPPGQIAAKSIAAGLQERAERVFSRPLSLGDFAELIQKRLRTVNEGGQRRNQSDSKPLHRQIK